MRNILMCGGIFISALVLSGCVTTVDKIQDIQQRAMMSMRKPGEKMVAPPEDASRRYSCSTYMKDKLVIEEIDVIPDRINAGDEINQRIRYGLCPNPPSGTMNGKIVRTVLFNGETQFEDITYYAFKPGTWTIDAFIQVPRDVDEGMYDVEVVVTYGSKTVRSVESFLVKKK
jgi:hypothetical protein